MSRLSDYRDRLYRRIRDALDRGDPVSLRMWAAAERVGLIMDDADGPEWGDDADDFYQYEDDSPSYV